MGFRLYSSNRLEKLAEMFADSFRASSPSDPMTPATVVVQTQGIAAYLRQALAAQTPIAANLDTPFLNRFFRRVLERLWGGAFRQAAENSAPETLRWRIDALLAEEPESYPELAAYLGDGRTEEAELRRWQLAEQLASLFDQYQVYRPDLLGVWRGGGGTGELDWQRRIFLRLTEGREWEFEYFDRFFRCGRLPAGVRFPPRVSVFGVSAMPPRYFRFFRQLARFAEVDFYYLNVCCEYWSDQYSRREIRHFLRRDGTAGGADFENGNPLLASLGTQGRNFFRQIMELPEEASAAEPAFVPYVEYAPGEPSPENYAPGTTLLHALQQDIFTMCGRRPGGDGVAAGRPLPVASGDRSVTVHNCHSVRRELEVLHDQLLELLQSPEIQPRDVIVMAPEIAAYAPVIGAVFDNGPLAGCYAIADRAPGAGRLRELFLELLEFRNRRFEASAVASIFDVPAIHRKFGFDAELASRVPDWIGAAGIRWGYDSAERRMSCGVGFEEYSWRFGLDRLLCGLAMEDVLPDAPTPPPAGRIGSEDRVAFGRFLDFVQRLAQLRERLRVRRTPSEWSSELSAALEEFFDADRESFEERSALRGALVRLEEDAARAGYDRPLPLEAVLEYLDGVWNAPGRSDPFLRGKITFCSLMPMRSVPMKVVVLLGMNDRAFPRRDRKTGFSLLENAVRAGDRSRTQEDRYLFLEAVLSARERLMFFYQGRSDRGDDRFPPAVPLGEVMDYLRTGFPGFEETEHRLQAFDFQYFRERPEPGFRSFSRENFLAAKALHEHFSEEWRGTAAAKRSRFSDGGAEPRRELTLDELERFFRNPAQGFLRERAGLKFVDADETLSDCEPFEPDSIEQYQLREAMLRLWLERVPFEEQYEYLRQIGRLPVGELGRGCFDRNRLRLERIPEAWRSRLAKAAHRYCRWECRTRILSGAVSLAPDNSELPLAFAGGLDGKRLLHGVLHQLTATAAGFGTPALTMLCFASGGAAVHRLPPVDPGDAAVRLGRLLELCDRGLCGPLPFFPSAAFEAAKADGDAKWKKARAAFDAKPVRGGERIPGVFDDPAVSYCFSEEEFEREPALRREFLDLAGMLFPVIPEKEELES